MCPFVELIDAIAIYMEKLCVVDSCPGAIKAQEHSNLLWAYAEVVPLKAFLLTPPKACCYSSRSPYTYTYFFERKVLLGRNPVARSRLHQDAASIT